MTLSGRRRRVAHAEIHFGQIHVVRSKNLRLTHSLALYEPLYNFGPIGQQNLHQLSPWSVVNNKRAQWNPMTQQLD
jgi:hypothetical protein